MDDDAINAHTIVWLATTRPDGRSHLTPIWHRYVDGRFWMCSLERAVKVRNLRANASCSVALPPVGTPSVAEGVATVHDRRDGPFPPRVVAAFVEAFDWDIDDDQEGYTSLIEIAVTRWRHGPQASTEA